MRILLLALAALPVFAASHTALDRYVGAPDPNYGYDMISRKWRTEQDVDHPLWHHRLTIIVPDRVEDTTAFLCLTGGSINADPPEQPDALIASVATSTKGGDDIWPLRLPMTKAAVRAMDTVSAVAKAKSLTAAVDKRVVAIVPLVIDVLNIERSLQHHYETYGSWAPSFADYADMKTFARFGAARFKKLMAIEDPYSYLDRLTMPKMIINSAGDQYFVPDSSQFYWKDLKGEKYLRYVPNTKHDLNDSDARETTQAFYTTMVNNEPRPQMDWTFDFRLDSIGNAYTSTVLDDKGGGLFIEVRITPDTLPSGPPRHPKH